ncbi:hypothetical protein H17ap60334_04977 [Thermosipho africanus H17ap60334]|uniref:phage head spike fiber domain-containing protein n=1 Tax=Thermosipho africanus TaxID=2421 RepID=UPI00028D1483|nr:hypothetical protein [Thermosipho africanus]EKF49537.1 hypothetical protein H17ap60334_04977 [Thermosipho africanus H17ap60334]
MALHKENYGLIYNDDGSLCTTIRADDIPFEGIKSFAVEEGTTNFYQNPLFKDGLTNWGYFNWYHLGGVGTISAVNIETPFGDTAVLMDNSTSSEDLAVTQTVALPNDTSTYTASAWVKNPSSTSCTLQLFAGLGYKTLATIPANSGWMRVSVTFNPGEYTKSAMHHWKIPPERRLYLTALQIEEKPFASSFVVGSRPKGRLVIPVEDLKFDIANDDWVISYWKYPVATSDDTQNGYNLCSLGQYTSDNSKGYIWWGKERDSNTFRVNVVYNNRTVAWAYSSTFDPNWYFNNWHFEVMKKQGKVLSYYVDGVKQCELIIPADKEIQTPFDVGLSLGGFSGSSPNNALIANLLIARYDPNIWTDEYIQALYDAKKPFAVPPKMPII